MNIVRVLIGWQIPTHVCQSFTRQIRVYQHKKLVKKFARIEASSICRQQFANMFADCFYAVHTHQLEFANTSLPTLVCRVKAALEIETVIFSLFIFFCCIDVYEANWLNPFVKLTLACRALTWCRRQLMTQR